MNIFALTFLSDFNKGDDLFLIEYIQNAYYTLEHCNAQNWDRKRNPQHEYFFKILT